MLQECPPLTTHKLRKKSPLMVNLSSGNLEFLCTHFSFRSFLGHINLLGGRTGKFDLFVSRKNWEIGFHHFVVTLFDGKIISFCQDARLTHFGDVGF